MFSKKTGIVVGLTTYSYSGRPYGVFLVCGPSRENRSDDSRNEASGCRFQSGSWSGD